MDDRFHFTSSVDISSSVHCVDILGSHSSLIAWYVVLWSCSPLSVVL